ncbi:MAG: stage II sporulation protein M, partial [Povalibacter sp.]
LDQLTHDAHQVIYQRREFGFARLKALIAYEIPQAVRKQSTYVWIATAVFVLPTLIIGLLVYFRPELILSVVDPATASDFERMYSPDAESIGRVRTAHTDWAMFGFYIRNNVGISFQCFAGGLFAGLGSLFFLGFNGAFGGAIAGYLTERGLASTFYSFVVTHAAFELTAIVLSGAAGLRIGHALLAPGRATRMQALVAASRESIVVMYGVAGMLLTAAAIEAFWSSARWIPPAMKYSVAAVCWIAVFGYLMFQGRRAS